MREVDRYLLLFGANANDETAAVVVTIEILTNCGLPFVSVKSVKT